MLSASDCLSYRSSCRICRSVVGPAFVTRRIHRWLESNRLTDIFAIEPSPSGAVSSLYDLLAMVGLTASGEVRYLRYLLGLLTALECSGDWDGWVWRLHVMKHFGTLYPIPHPNRPIVLKPAHVRQAFCISRRYSLPDSVRQYLLFGQFLMDASGIDLSVEPDHNGSGWLGARWAPLQWYMLRWSCESVCLAGGPFGCTYDENDPVCTVYDRTGDYPSWSDCSCSSFRDAVCSRIGNLVTILVRNVAVTRASAAGHPHVRDRIHHLTAQSPPVFGRHTVTTVAEGVPDTHNLERTVYLCGDEPHDTFVAYVTFHVYGGASTASVLLHTTERPAAKAGGVVERFPKTVALAYRVMGRADVEILLGCL
ncbi:unnamed protein product [Vitrella brassicaformis CCMP3155]|uniref:Uncharacterized protein n=2 Tax=Vitrella brassicaformis TaxID=1169539 RepID=A0A0G4EWX2_VITBC|nr:unnamed protein product [Vitrella brassicaformis CCMP3155]|eukprot:CEM03273.1 unnamed protein product [Vitrella brassicaformis CCMP3155]